MIKHKNKLIGISLATIVLVAMIAVASLSVSAAKPTVKAPVGSAPATFPSFPAPGAAVVSSTDGNVYCTANGFVATPTWTSIGKPAGGISGDPAAVTDIAGIFGGNTYVFVNSGGALWVKVVQGFAPGFPVVADWAQVPGTSLAAGIGPGGCWDYASGNLHVFYVGSATHELEWTYLSSGGSWSAPQNLGGVLSSSPNAVNPTGDIIDVFGRGQSGGLWQAESATGGFSWSEVPGYGYLLAGTGPWAVCSVPGWVYGSILVFVAGGSGQLYYQFYNAGTGTWHTAPTGTGYYLVGGVLTASPAATISVFSANVMVRGGDGNLYWNAGPTPVMPIVWPAWSGPIVNVP